MLIHWNSITPSMHTVGRMMRWFLLFAVTVCMISQGDLSWIFLEQEEELAVVPHPGLVEGSLPQQPHQALTHQIQSHHLKRAGEVRKQEITNGVLPEQPLQALPNYIRQQNCPADIDHLGYIAQRTKERQMGKSTWQQRATLNDKWLFYLFARHHGFNVPKIHFCSTGGAKDLEQWDPSPSINQQGFVVKIKEGQNSKGVYLLESGFGGREVLRNRRKMTRKQIIGALRQDLKTSNFSGKLKEASQHDFHVEEYLPGPDGLPSMDYKVFVADQSVAAVEVIANRGTANKCLATVNEKFERMDEQGCFSNQEKYHFKPNEETNNKCNVPLEGNPYDPLPKCSGFAKPAAWDAVVQTAKEVSKLIGIFVRLDMYVLDGKVYLGEATFLPRLGVFHCASQLDQNGCIDSCILGRLWKEKNNQYNTTEGGPRLPEPEYVQEWRKMSPADQCRAVMAA